MLKEIMEQPRVVQDCLTGRLLQTSEGLRVSLRELDDLPTPTRLRIVACGTSYHAGLWAQQLELALEELVISVQWVQHFLHFLCLLGGGLQGLGQLDVRQDLR